MLNPTQFSHVRMDAELANMKLKSHEGAKEEIPFNHPYWSNHSMHDVNPMYKSLGWGNEHNCAYDSCAHANDKLTDWDSDFNKSSFQGSWSSKILRPSREPLVAHEPFSDTGHIKRIVDEGSAPNRSGAPRVVPTDGRLHIVDGHHRLAAAAISNKAIPVEVWKP